MEVDPTANEGSSESSGNPFAGLLGMGGGNTEGGEGGMDFMKEIMGSVPGIDEATSFGEVIKSLDEYNFDLIIFDTAPTGHTLRLLNFPNILEKGLLKLMELKDKFGGMMNSVSAMAGQGQDMTKQLFDKMDVMKTKIEQVNT